MEKIAFACLAAILALLAISCDSGPDFVRNVDVLGNGPFAITQPAPWASRGADVEVTLINDATDPSVVHDWILTDPDDGHVIASIENVSAGQYKSVRFYSPVPPTLAGKDYPFHCSQPGHDESGVFSVPAAPPKSVQSNTAP